jgi:Tol biopolymer transport system component
MFPDGTNVVQITDDSGRKGHPDWSPDGSQIVYAADYFNGTPQAYSELYIVNADGSGRFIIPDTRHARHPRWSPDGTTIAFEQLIRWQRGHLRDRYGWLGQIAANN